MTEHCKRLGSSRLASKPDRTTHFSGAYAPFGEEYALSGTPDLDFTGQNQDTVTGDYDFMFREYSPVQGRWVSPDPLGLEAANLTDPQSWNAYAYVVNGPLGFIDALGLNHCPPDYPCPGSHDDPPIHDDGNGRGPGRSGGCRIVMGSIVIELLACPSIGGGREREFVERIIERIKESLKQAANAVACGALSGPLETAKGLQRATGGVVQVGFGGVAAGGLPNRASISGQASATVAADCLGQTAIVLTLGGGRGTGSGFVAGGQFSVSPLGDSVQQLRSYAVTGAGAITRGRVGGEVQVSSTAGGTLTLTGGPALSPTGGFSVAGGTVHSWVIPISCGTTESQNQ